MQLHMLHCQAIACERLQQFVPAPCYTHHDHLAQKPIKVVVADADMLHGWFLLPSYPDFTMTSSGLQYKDLRAGTGDAPHPGDTLVVDWAGYTIGYYGRPFEARNKVITVSSSCMPCICSIASVTVRLADTQ